MSAHRSAAASCGWLDLHLLDRHQLTAGMLERTIRAGWQRWRQDVEEDVLTSGMNTQVAQPVIPNRLMVDLVLTTGASGRVEFRIRRNVVEVWLTGSEVEPHSCGVIDREYLRAWLTEPADALAFDQVMIRIDRRVDVVGRLELTLPGVSGWALAACDSDRLTKRV